MKHRSTSTTQSPKRSGMGFVYTVLMLGLVFIVVPSLQVFLSWQGVLVVGLSIAWFKTYRPSIRLGVDQNKNFINGIKSAASAIFLLIVLAGLADGSIFALFIAVFVLCLFGVSLFYERSPQSHMAAIGREIGELSNEEREILLEALLSHVSIEPDSETQDALVASGPRMTKIDIT